MKRIGIIPLRAGSKSIRHKNKRKMLGRPLYQWVLGEAIFSKLDEIYVFTDDKEIIEQVNLDYCWTKKVKCMHRSIESALDNSSTEMAMLEFAKNINNEFDIICLLQATSPLTTSKEIDACLSKIELEKFDSALSVVESKRFIWSDAGESLNYDYLDRPRRQEFNGQLIENGAIYTARKDTFLSNKNRIGNSIGIVKMPEDTLIEIDEPSDWIISESLLQNRIGKFKGLPKPIRAIVFDVDGVFTDGTVAVTSGSELFKRFSLRDGMGIELLKRMNILPIVITSEDSQIVSTRMKKLHIENFYFGVKDKYSRLHSILAKLSISRNEVAYVGDDINDLANMLSVSWAIAPQNAHHIVKYKADLILNSNGGDLAIREAIEFIEKYNKKFEI